jgi:GntR family transcriptional repressor for pyruvate dehydrogenase complex
VKNKRNQKPRTRPSKSNGGGKTATRLAKAIVREIRRRSLLPGDKLLSEQKMVERYGVARGSLREALRYLELQGVLRLKTGPGGGPVVETPSAHHLASTLALLLQFGAAPFRAIIETRAVLEPGMAGLAARNATAGDLGAMDECLAAMRAAIGDPAAFREENRRLHDLIAFASGNAVFRVLIPALHWISDGSGIDYSGDERRVTIGAMEQILEAIRRREEEAAAQAMDRFFKASLTYLGHAYPEIMSRVVAWDRLDF